MTSGSRLSVSHEPAQLFTPSLPFERELEGRFQLQPEPAAATLARVLPPLYLPFSRRLYARR